MEAQEIRIGRRYVAILDGKRIGVVIRKRITEEPLTWACHDDYGRHTFVHLHELVEMLMLPFRRSNDARPSK